jgi:hypothetical protein
MGTICSSWDLAGGVVLRRSSMKIFLRCDPPNGLIATSRDGQRIRHCLPASVPKREKESAMNGMSILKRVVGVAVAAICMAALSPLATANADTYASSYSAVITANPTAAGISQAVLPPLDACSLRVLCLSRSRDGAFTAYSTLSVGPTPYYISIFNTTTRQRLALCGSGTTCTTSIYVGPPLNTCYDYMSFIGSTSLAIPPSPVYSSSNSVTLCNWLR